MARIFILCTGRCGSVTFAKACEHATNFTVGHESVGLRHGLEFPDDHIEVNCRLVWYLGLLVCKYPDARYVHLMRDPEATARSFAPRTTKPFQIMLAWRRGIRMGWLADRGDPERPIVEDAREYVDAVNALIELCGKHCAKVRLGQPESFGQFWDVCGLEGDRAAAVRTFQAVHHSSPPARRHSPESPFY